MRILITIGRLNVGGAEMRLLQLIELLQKRAGLPIEVAIYIVSGLSGTLDSRYRAAGARLYYGRTGAAGLVRLWRICRNWRPDVLHVNADSAAGFFGAAGALSGIDVRIAHFRQTRSADSLPRKIRAVIYEFCTSVFCNRHVGVCEAAREHRWLFRPWTTIYNGLSVPDFSILDAMPMPAAYSPSALRIVVLGRLTRQKNIVRAIEIIATLQGRISDIQLHLVGPHIDIDAEEIIDWTRRLGVQEKVTLHGETDFPWPFLFHANVCLMPSRSEGLPGVVLESLACGTPVVASDLPGTREIACQTIGVDLLSLSLDDDHWANALIEAATRTRSDIRSSFARSPFQPDRYVEEVVRLWNGGVLVRDAR